MKKKLLTSLILALTGIANAQLFVKDGSYVFMTNQYMTRRIVLGGISILALTPLSAIAKAATRPTINAYRNPGCGCCEKWAEMLKSAGFEVTMEDAPDLSSRRVP